jgi:hypothetical protein
LTGLNHNVEAGATAPAFTLLEGPCETRYSLPMEEVEDQIRTNVRRDVPRLHHKIDYGKSKRGRPLAIVGGGPSLRQTMDQLREFEDIMVVGSAHDFIVNHGFTPKYAVVCSARNDEGESPKDFIKYPRYYCEYLLASCCHPSLFDALANQNVTLWNSAGRVDNEVFNGEPFITGGSTVTLRAINVAIVLGYYDMHFFGFDSCFESVEDNHAYDAGSNSIEHEIIKVRVGHPETGREFLTHTAWLIQAQHFQEVMQFTGHLFNPTIHGDGLIAEIMKHRKAA